MLMGGVKILKYSNREALAVIDRREDSNDFFSSIVNFDVIYTFTQTK
ncbi:MAG: hypothetical protein PWP56_1104 [Acetobacterium sp.]|nr:hypothetical protein [Acetobacterium sp.]